MLIIVNKNTGKECQRINEDGVKTIKLNENEIAHYFPNDSEIAQKLMFAHEYNLDVDSKGKCIDATVTKTKEQWLSERPEPPPSTKEIAIKELKKIDKKSTKPEDVLKRLEIIETILFPEV